MINYNMQFYGTYDGKTIETRKFDMVVATDLNWGIGKNNQLLAKIPEDMKFFRELTKNSIVIMGRKTSESLPLGYLKNRINIIISRKPLKIPSETQRKEHIYHAAEKDEALMIVEQIMRTNQNYDLQPNVYVIGGGTIYNEFLKHNLIQRSEDNTFERSVLTTKGALNCCR